MVNVMKSRRGGFYDISFCKNQIYDARLMSSSANLRFNIRHLARIINEYAEKDEPAPVILVIGHHPAFYLGSQALIPFGVNDYLTVAGFLREPLRLTPSVTWGDEFLVPADAELIIEGELLPKVRRKQNPFGEFSGHYQAERMAPVIEAKAITHRRSAIVQAIFPAHADHLNIACVPREGSLLSALRRVVPGVTAVHLPSWGCSRFSCVVALRKESPADVQKAAMTAFTNLDDCKMVIVVDPDIDVYNHHDVWWAVVTQARFESDLTVIPNAQSFRSWLGTSVAVIDATRPDDPEFPERCMIPEEILERVKITG
jgi:UbiD family decarboxylase